MCSESDNKTATLKNISIIEEKMGFFIRITTMFSKRLANIRTDYIK